MIKFRPNVEAMAPYVPGEQPAAGTKVIKLNTNENPYPPSPKVVEAIRNEMGEPFAAVKLTTAKHAEPAFEFVEL